MSGDRIIHGAEAERRRLYVYEGQDRSHRRVFSREASIRIFIGIACLLLGVLL
jgi:hypothetical protein